MAKNKLTIKNIIIELSTSGIFVLGFLYFGWYYLTTGSLPGCSINLTFPITLLAIGGFGGNLRAIMSKFLK